MPEVLQRRDDGSVAHVRLARPAVRNALNPDLISAITETFNALASEQKIRAVVLSGEGHLFCAGADIGWMRDSLDLDEEANFQDALRLSEMYRAIDRCPKPVIGRVQGAALGGGAGLVAVCDTVIAASDAVFAFTEVKLGIIPAVISPFVLGKIGYSHARALCLTGERFEAKRALSIGLVHEVVVADTLDVAVERVVSEVLSAGPNAVATAKALLARIRETSYTDSRDITAGAIARQRVSDEGQEGLRAFLERRKAGWNS